MRCMHVKMSRYTDHGSIDSFLNLVCEAVVASSPPMRRASLSRHVLFFLLSDEMYGRKIVVAIAVDLIDVTSI